MSDEERFKVVASVRVNDYGYDVVLDRGSYHTKRWVPGGTHSGDHTPAEALRLLSDLAALAEPER